MTKCLIPWTNLDIAPLGDITPCCKFQTKYYDKEFNIVNDNIDDYLKSDMLKNVKEEMLDDKWPKGCERCKIEEENNIKSKRQLDYIRWKEEYENYDESKGFITASIAFGNTCNLKCITCGPTSSSRWRKEHLDLYGVDVPPVEVLNEENYKNLYKHMPNIIHLDIPGGEPFLSEVEKQKKLLNTYIDNGQSKEISIHYTTNAQLFPSDEWWELWSHFKEIDMQLSIDGIGNQYEYIRYPGKWSLLCDNVTKFVSYERDLDNVRLSVSHTVSAYNIYYLSEFFDWCKQVGLPAPYCGRVHSPMHMRPSVYPDAVKKKIIDHLHTSKHEEIVSWISLLENSDDGQYYKVFHDMCDKHDRYRNLDYKKTFPELSKLINDQSKEHHQ